MTSQTLPSFWDSYSTLSDNTRKAARKAYRLWRDNPFHPSLHFKCVHPVERVWSVRITLGFRALGVFDKETITWFWIGSHEEYLRRF
ncbi:MAG: hypothetical protein HYT87_14060 [Nitrospirae bacterium]|nr:hypothetical protein [Nitrospirota bacterium]